MKILEIQSFEGPNIYSLRPVTKAILDVGSLSDTPSNKIDNFNEGLLNYLPELRNHHCSKGFRGGFVQRLEEGTYLPHITEHIAIELQNICGDNVHYGKARVLDEPNLYYIIVEHKNSILARECILTAIGIINSLIDKVSYHFDEKIIKLKQLSIETSLGPSTKAIYDEALKNSIPVKRLGNESLLQLGYGKNIRYIQASMTDGPACISIDIAGDKCLTKQLLERSNIPVPHGEIAFSIDNAIYIASSIGYPVVVKPFDGNQGRGVSINLKDENEVLTALEKAFEISKAVIVEKYIKGKDYRVLVVGGKVIAVAERRPPSIVGDGLKTIKELIEIENSSDLRGVDHEKPLTKIKMDKICNEVLKKQNVSLDTILEKGKRVLLRENGNLSTGGTARECTSEIHPYNIKVAIEAANSLNLDIAGIDFTIEDISLPINECGGAIIEVNAAPGLRMHIFPTEGESINVAEKIISMLYPDISKASIPIVSVTGTNGKTTTTRMIAHTLRVAGMNVGMTTTSGIYINGKLIQKGDNTGPISAMAVLTNPTVDAAVLETARGGIIKKGLAYNEADVAVLTNISEDHLGLDGIKTLEDLAFVKSLVIETVKKDGYCVLNADDSMVTYLLKRANGNVILFSIDGKSLLFKGHVESGGIGVTIIDGYAVILKDNVEIPIMPISEIPASFKGTLKCNIENSLAAISALFGLGLDISDISVGLRSFSTDKDVNPGRFNIISLKEYSIMLDYGHNIEGYKAVLDFTKGLKKNQIVGIIGMPGDRKDDDLYKVGELCAKSFDRIIIKEDMDLRGREPGEVADIFYDAIIKAGMNPKNVEIIYSECEAIRSALSNAKEGDFIVAFYEDFEASLSEIEKFKEFEAIKESPNSDIA